MTLVALNYTVLDCFRLVYEGKKLSVGIVTILCGRLVPLGKESSTSVYSSARELQAGLEPHPHRGDGHQKYG